MKTSLMFASLMLAVSLGFAQAEPGAALSATDAQAELSTPTAEVEEVTARDAVSQFLDKKGWSEGLNKRGNGSVFYISVGYGTIAIPASHPQYTNARIFAFKKALLGAKAEMAKYFESAIAAAAAYSLSTPEMMPDPSDEAKALAEMPDDSLVGKTVKLMSVKLDNALKKEGYDIEAERAKASANLDALKDKQSRLLSSEEFREDISLGSRCAISGMQVHLTIEAPKDRQMAVVAIWSPMLGEMADSLVLGKTVPKKAPKKPIRAQIPAANKDYISLFGVQQKINERGELVLVSFAQAVARNDRSPALRNAAFAKSMLSASAQIRQFAGEAVSVNESSSAAESSQEYDGQEVPDYSSSDKYEMFQQSVAKSMPINGISKFKQWSAKHPVTGQMIYGTVATWSPDQAFLARTLKKKVEETAKLGAEGLRKVPAESSGFRPAGASSEPDRGSTNHVIITNDIGDDDAF